MTDSEIIAKILESRAIANPSAEPEVSFSTSEVEWNDARDGGIVVLHLSGSRRVERVPFRMDRGIVRPDHQKATHQDE